MEINHDQRVLFYLINVAYIKYMFRNTTKHLWSTECNQEAIQFLFYISRYYLMIYAFFNELLCSFYPLNLKLGVYFKL